MTLALALLTGGAMAQASDDGAISGDTLTDADVAEAMEAITAELLRLKDPERHWEPPEPPPGESTRQEGGYTALVVLALLHSGMSHQSDELRETIEYLEQSSMRGTYARAIRASIWAQLPDRYRRPLQDDAEWLMKGFSPRSGGWDYVQRSTISVYDNSIRQYGALGLWEASKRGVRVPQGLWEVLETRLVETQQGDGGWNYREGRPTSGSMTAAGLSTLFITQDVLHGRSYVGLRPSEAAQRNQAAIDRGLEWMDRNFTVAENPGLLREYFYYMYGVERAGLAGGLREFGGVDWFRSGAAAIIMRLCEWDPETRRWKANPPSADPSALWTRQLAFGLLFLSRGHAPVAIHKLAVDGMRSNNRPRDAANLAAVISEALERDHLWQMVSIDAPVERWLDAPLLYFASDEAIPWVESIEMDPRRFQREVGDYLEKRAAGTLEEGEAPPRIELPDHARKIKAHLNRGGMVLAVNEGRGQSFSRSIEALGQYLYPQYEWRELPSDHWAFTMHHTVERPRLRAIGLSNGVRELMVLISRGDPAAALQVDPDPDDPEVQTMVNLALYASERGEPRPLLAGPETPSVAAQQHWPDATVARIMHGGNWRPEAGAWDAFRDWLGTTASPIDVRIVDRTAEDLAKTEDDEPPAIAHLVGLDAQRIAEENIAQLAAVANEMNAAQRGLLVIESIGGGTGFAASVGARLAEALGGEVVSIGAEHPLISGGGFLGGRDVSRIEYRPYALTFFGVRETSPRIQVIRMDGRDRIVLIADDVSNALLDQPVWGIAGYTTESARLIMSNLLRYGMSETIDDGGENAHPPQSP